MAPVEDRPYVEPEAPAANPVLSVPAELARPKAKKPTQTLLNTWPCYKHTNPEESNTDPDIAAHPYIFGADNHPNTVEVSRRDNKKHHRQHDMTLSR